MLRSRSLNTFIKYAPISLAEQLTKCAPISIAEQLTKCDPISLTEQLTKCVPISLKQMQTKSHSISLTDQFTKCAPISLNECAAEVGFDHSRWVSGSGPGLPPAKLVNTAGQLVSVLRRFGFARYDLN